jgi:hypothetical protein
VDDEATTPEPTTRIAVVGGGPVPAEHLAALVVALTPTGGDGPADPEPPGPPAWARAALLEGVGLPRPTRPSDLRRITVLG